MQKNIIFLLLYIKHRDIKKKQKEGRKVMEKKDNIELEKIKQEQVKKIKQAIESIVEESKNDNVKKERMTVLFLWNLNLFNIFLHFY